MAWQVHYLDAHGRVAPLKDAVEAALADAEARIREVCTPPVVDIIVRTVPDNWVIPEKGYAGYCSGEVVEIRLAPEHPKFAENLGVPLSQMIAHEMHHAMRIQSCGQTFGDALVTEGLAGRFVEELFGNAPEPRECALSREELSGHVPLALSLFESHEFDHMEWMYGTGRLPRWLGYTLGYELVGAHIAANDGASASALAAAPSIAFKPALAGLAV